METIANEIIEFDVYKSSKEYVKSNVNRHYCKGRNSWKVPVSLYEPVAFKAFNIKKIKRLKNNKVMSSSYIAYKENEISPFTKIELKENIFLINKELKEIAEEIKLSEELLDFEENLDYESTLKISEELYFEAIKFLIYYSEFIFKSLGVIIQTPEINAGRKGNVYLAWRTKNARLAISIEKSKTSEVIANYYGDLGNDREPIKGNVSIGKISEYLAHWMKYLA